MSRWQVLWKDDKVAEAWKMPDESVIRLSKQLKAEGKKRMLDLGCGVGRHLFHLAKEGFEVHGLDNSSEGLKRTSEWLKDEGLSATLVTGDMGAIPYPDSFFDAVVAFHVIYHATYEDMKKVVEGMNSKLASGGYLLLTLISTKHSHYGVGREIEKNSFVDEHDREKSTIHHYSDEEEARELLKEFQIIEIEDTDKGDPGSYHWKILCCKG